MKRRHLFRTELKYDFGNRRFYISVPVSYTHLDVYKRQLVECVNEHDNHLMTGRMSNNLLVHFPGDESLIGQLVDVHLDECKGFYYMGMIESN